MVKDYVQWGGENEEKNTNGKANKNAKPRGGEEKCIFKKWGLEYKRDNGEPIRNVRSKFYRATGNGRPGACAQARSYYGEFFLSPQI